MDRLRVLGLRPPQGEMVRHRRPAYIGYIKYISYTHTSDTHLIHAYIAYIAHIGYIVHIATANLHTLAQILGPKQHSIVLKHATHMNIKKHKKALDAVLVNLGYYSDTLQH